MDWPSLLALILGLALLLILGLAQLLLGSFLCCPCFAWALAPTQGRTGFIAFLGGAVALAALYAVAGWLLAWLGRLDGPSLGALILGLASLTRSFWWAWALGLAARSWAVFIACLGRAVPLWGLWAGIGWGLGWLVSKVVL